MSIKDVFRLALRIFKNNRLRTFLTILGIAVGVAAIVFLVTLGYGLQKLTVEKITSSEALSALEVKPSSGDKVKDLTDSMVTKIKQLSQVAYVGKVVTVAGQVIFNDTPGDISIYGVGEKYFDLEGLSFAAGQGFETGETGQLVVTSAVLEQFSKNVKNLPTETVSLSYFVTDSADGATKQVHDPKKYHIKGVIIDDLQANIYLPVEVVKGFAPDQKIDSLKVQVKSQDKINGTRDKISAMGYSVSTVIDMVEQLEKGFKVVRVALGFLGIIALLVASIGMFNTLTISLLERIKEVGIMKAIGAADRDIYKVFMVEALLIGFFGGVLGLILGYIGSSAINLIFNTLAHAFQGQVVKLFFYPFWFILGVLTFSCLVAFVTGIYPARRAARLNPLQALRYE